MKRYDSYKDSSISWLGEIPENWEIRRVKDVGGYQSGKFIDANELDASNEFAVYGGNGIRGNANKYNHNGDYILIGRQGALCGNINLASGKFWATEHAVVVYRKRNVNIKWLAEIFRIMNFNQYSVSAAQPGLAVDRIKRLELPIPSLTEQTTIAQYLDTKTQAIDKKVKLLEQKIRYYKELRKSIINKVVTKGLDGNTKNWKNVRLKDIGYLYSGLSGKSGDDFNQDENPNSKRFIPFTNIANNTYIDQTNFGTVVMSENEKQNCVRSGDLFFLMSSEGYEDIGKTAVLENDMGEVYLNSFCKGYRINNNKYFAPFINYLLLSDTYRKKMIVEGKGFTRINLKMEKVNDFEIFIPNSKPEQTEIAQYLDEKTSTIDRIVKNIETQITTLKELRKTLVNYVVMGKIKVVEA